MNGAPPQPFADRASAGLALARALAPYRERQDLLVLGLPRGGVPVAFAVARELHAPLDVFLVRKLGVPGHEELAMGAIASGGIRVINDAVVRELGISAEEIERVSAREQAELEQRQRRYREGRPPPDLHGRTVVLVDDGLATGSTMRAAVRAARQGDAARVVIAVPVAPAQSCEELRALADEVVCLVAPLHFIAVGYWYDDFEQTTDDEVRNLLARSTAPQRSPGAKPAQVDAEGHPPGC